MFCILSMSFMFSLVKLLFHTVQDCSNLLRTNEKYKGYRDVLESWLHKCSEGNQDYKKAWYPIANDNKVWVGTLTPQPSINEVGDF